MLPSWFKPYAGPPSSIPSADGAIYYAHLGSNTRGSLAEQKASFRVYVFVRRGATCEEVPIDTTKVPDNQASFREEIDGTLTLVGTRGGVLAELSIPGYVAKREGASAPPEAATELHDEDYESLDELFSTPGFLVRFNKQLRALIQLRRLARARGWLT